MSDDDQPQATEDEIVQGYLEQRWRSAMTAGQIGMSDLRDVWPQLVQHLPETAARHIKIALDDFESAVRSLHMAGKFVLGQENYDVYVAEDTDRSIARRRAEITQEHP